MFRKIVAQKQTPDDAVEPGRRRLLAWGCACCAFAALPAQAAQADGPVPAAVHRHLDLARQAAGNDLDTYLKLGDIALPQRAAAAKFDLAALINRPAPPPGQAFDDLFFVGSHWVSAWVIRTSDGLILVDALNNDEEAQRVIEQGMRRLGLDPAQIRIVLITHGHGDHYGGIHHIQKLAAPRVLMTAQDWSMMETKLEFDPPQWGRPPRRDVTVHDGEKVTLGNTTVEVLHTPGHTMGTLSLLFTVRQKGQEHRALLWGGTSFNFGAQPDRLERLLAYIDATDRVRDLARRRDADVFISNHSTFDRAAAKLERIASGSAANPFINGTETTVRALTVMNECAQATLAAWTA